VKLADAVAIGAGANRQHRHLERFGRIVRMYTLPAATGVCTVKTLLALAASNASS
jgi:hypothetical protein